MLKIIKMISLYFLATTICEYSSLNIPQHLLRSNQSLHHVTVTAYTNVPGCTRNNPNVTSSSYRISPKAYSKVIALSSDLSKGHDFGDRFSLCVRGKVYEVVYEDRMPKKHRKKVDLLLGSLDMCKKFGRNPGVLIAMDKT